MNLEFTNDYDSNLEGLVLNQKKLDLSLGLRYLTAGKSILTFHNSKTGTSHTYLIKCSNMIWRNRYYVSVFSGRDNTKDYKYIGVIEYKDKKYSFSFAPTHIKAECHMSIDAPSVQAFMKIFDRLNNLGYVYNNNGFPALTSDFSFAHKFATEQHAKDFIAKHKYSSYVIERYVDTKKHRDKNTWKAEIICEYYSIHTPVISNSLEIWRSTHCLRCGCLLTNKKSIERDFGPHCIKQFNNGY
jgi:hypothetical protein